MDSSNYIPGRKAGGGAWTIQETQQNDACKPRLDSDKIKLKKIKKKRKKIPWIIFLGQLGKCEQELDFRNDTLLLLVFSGEKTVWLYNGINVLI